MYKVNKMGPK